MQLKKSPKASLEDKKLTYVLMGLVLVLSICYVAFEWTEKEVTKYEVNDTDFFFEEEIDIQQTTQETPPPPPPPAVQGKESACNAGNPSMISGSGRSTVEGTGYPIQCS